MERHTENEKGKKTTRYSSKLMRKQKTAQLIVLFILIGIIAIMYVILANFDRLSNESQFSDIAITTNNEKILASETIIEHECRSYYVSKYDKTNHWSECSICGKKYNIIAHTFTENWTMGESCDWQNKCNHICSCGYSYQTENTRKHNLSEWRNESDRVLHYKTCSNCGRWVESGSCIKEDGTLITCRNLGTCKICKHNYSSLKHTGVNNYDANKNNANSMEVKCKLCNKHIGRVYNIKTNHTGNQFEMSYDFDVSDTGNFNSSNLYRSI